jgi:hypothetical protein
MLSPIPDWNAGDDNLLRALLALPTNGLAVITDMGMPAGWDLDALGVGLTLGDAQRCSIDRRGGLVSVRTSFILGDPTLRLGMVEPPSDPTATVSTNGSVYLSWVLPAEQVLGFWVYRSCNPAITNAADFARLTASIHEATNYTDLNPPSGPKVYQIRAIARQANYEDGSTFTNLSQGVFVDVSQ